MKLREDPFGWSPTEAMCLSRHRKPPLWVRLRDTALVTAIGALGFLAIFLICRGMGWCQEAPRTWQVTIAWDANTETDLEGYRLYSAPTAGGQSLDPAQAIATAGPAATEMTVPFEAGDHYLVLTAYDTSLNQSGRSNEVKLHLDEEAPGEPVIRIKVIVQVEVTTDQGLQWGGITNTEQ